MTATPNHFAGILASLERIRRRATLLEAGGAPRAEELKRLHAGLIAAEVHTQIADTKQMLARLGIVDHGADR